LDDDGQTHEINSEDVNNYLREITGQDFTAKDFRTWNGTLLTIEFFLERNSESPTRPAAMKKTVNDAIRHVAEELGNTMAVCRKCYIHPAVIEAFQSNALTRLKTSRKQKQNGASIDRGLRSSERILLQLLSQPTLSAGKKAA
jgi:DNA topoisomerase-1